MVDDATETIVHVMGLPFAFVIAHVIVPCGVATFDATAATFAVNVTELPGVSGSDDSFRVSVVAAPLTTVSVRGEAFDGENADEPEYAAPTVIGDWTAPIPAESVHVATPSESVTVSLPVQAGAGPVPEAANEKVTVPPGVPLAGDTDCTVAVNVGASPLAAGFSDDCSWT
jgi:hypothetical protein